MSAPSTCVGSGDAGDAQVDFHEVVEAAERLPRAGGGHLGLLVLGVALRRLCLGRRGERFAVGFDQPFDQLGIDARQQVLVGVDRMPGGEQTIGVGPGQRGDVEELLALRRDAGQDGLEQHGEQAEQVERIAARRMQFALPPFLLGKFPGLDAVDVLVGGVGEQHDLAHRLGEFARLVVLGDSRRGGADGADRRQLGGGRRQLPGEAFGDEAGGAAGDIDVLADQVGIDAGDEILEVEVDVLHTCRQLGGVVIAQPLRVEAGGEVALRR